MLADSSAIVHNILSVIPDGIACLVISILSFFYQKSSKSCSKLSLPWSTGYHPDDTIEGRPSYLDMEIATPPETDTEEIVAIQKSTASR